MEITTLFQGETADKIVQDIPVQATPFVGLEPGDYVGVGLRFPNGRYHLRPGNGGPECLHRLVTAYRAMKLAEKITEFDQQTLRYCLNAANSRVSWHGWQEEAVSKIKQAIGAESLQEILIRPLPSLDEALRTLEEQGSHVDALELVREIKEGRLVPTETVTKVIDSYSDENLVFRGITGKYLGAYFQLALKSEDPQSVFCHYAAARNKAIYVTLPLGEVEDYVLNKIISAYVLAADRFVHRTFPSLRAGYNSLLEELAASGGKMPSEPQLPKPSLFSRWWGKTFRQAKEEATSVSPLQYVYPDLQRTAKTFERIESLSDLPWPKRFIDYNDSFQSLGQNFNSLKWGFSSVAADLQNKPQEGYLTGQVRHLSQQARTLVVELNRGLRTHMSEMYALTG